MITSRCGPTTGGAALEPYSQPQMTENMMKQVNEEHSRIIACESGARLAGEGVGELFDAAPAHLTHHHPELLGAPELETVSRMSVEVQGAN
jgi:hypothetical protein